MKKHNFSLLVSLAALLAFTAACTTKTQEYAAADGSVKATLNERTGEWHITGPDGREVVPEYDSMRVTEVSADGHPMTVVYYSGAVQHWLQYYSTMSLRSQGDIIAGVREGHWVFYHPAGNIQAEATYFGGREEGAYRVYRENVSTYQHLTYQLLSQSLQRSRGGRLAGVSRRLPLCPWADPSGCCGG